MLLYHVTDAVPKDGETACDLHAELKDLMKQMIQEARTHPPLSVSERMERKKNNLGLVIVVSESEMNPCLLTINTF